MPFPRCRNKQEPASESPSRFRDRFRRTKRAEEGQACEEPQASVTTGVKTLPSEDETASLIPIPIGDIGEAIPDPTPVSLWDRAYDALKEKDSALVTKYEKLLSKELGPPGVGVGVDIDEANLDNLENQVNQSNPQERRTQLDKIAQDGLQRIDEKKIKYRIAGREFILRDQVAQASELVLWAKDWIGDAVKASPEASTVWAGVCIVLPLLTKANAANGANLDGFTYVTTRMRYYVALEPLLQPQNCGFLGGSVPATLITEFETHIVDLYQHILDFQLRSILRFFRNQVGNFGRDLIEHENWTKMRSAIDELEMIVRNDSQQINTSSSRQELEKISRNAGSSLQVMQKFLTVAEKHLDVAEEHLQIQKEIDRRNRTEKEEKCHRSFRLTKDERDGSYEWYKDRIEDRVDGTCQWFLQHGNFREWLDQDSGPLLVSADPGCGKSVLAKYLIDSELPRSAIICYFFFKDGDQNTLKQALCAILHQLFTHKPLLIRHAMPEYTKNGPSLVNVTSSLWSILESASRDTEMGPGVIILDALDECNETGLLDLVRLLRKFFHEEKGNAQKIKFLLTSRPYDSIISEFQELISIFPHIHIPGEDQSDIISQEVNHVITHRVKQLARDMNLRVDVEEHLEQRLLAIPHRTYLWVYLVFDYLKTQDFRKTKKGVELSLITLPATVNQAYEDILRRSKHHQEVRKALCIILAARRPLTLQEMNIALNIDASSMYIEELDLETEIDFKKTLRNWCGLFVSVYDDKVYFLHQTAREFLLEQPPGVLNDTALLSQWHGSITLQQAHSVLAGSCVAYIHILSPDDVVDFEKSLPFIKYSAEFWTVHFKEASTGVGNAIVSLAINICDPVSHQFLKWIEVYEKELYESVSIIMLPNSLMASCYFGLELLVETILAPDDGAINSTGAEGRTPLSYAAESSQEKIVELLLARRDITPDKRNISGRTALSFAAAEGKSNVVRLLLARKDVDVNSRDDDGQTPLSFASKRGKSSTIKLLLEHKDIQVNSRDKKGRTPLSLASDWGKNSTVELLLEHKDIQVNSRDNNGRTPLSLASEGGRSRTVKSLLEYKDIQVNVRDQFGQTPVSLAAQNGKNGTVELLLAREDVDLMSKDQDGNSPLDYAKEYCSPRIVKLFQDECLRRERLQGSASASSETDIPKHGATEEY